MVEAACVFLCVVDLTSHRKIMSVIDNREEVASLTPLLPVVPASSLEGVSPPLDGFVPLLSSVALAFGPVPVAILGFCPCSERPRSPNLSGV